MTQDDSDIGKLVEANQRFYEAFSTLDIEEMARVWEPSERARCVHPGWPLLSGWEPIRQSWESIFNHTTLMHFVLTEVQAVVQGESGWVDCVENITSVMDGRASSFSIRSTNIFARSVDRWLMVHHHASG